MQSITVRENIIVGRHSGKALPQGNIEIDDTMSETLRILGEASRSDGREGIIEWNDGSPGLPVETRPLIDILINGSSSDIMVEVGSNFEVQLTMTPPYDGNLVIPVFNRRFLFNFVGGVATKQIAVTESKEYNISSDSNFRVVTPITIDAVE